MFFCTPNLEPSLGEECLLVPSCFRGEVPFPQLPQSLAVQSPLSFLLVHKPEAPSMMKLGMGGSREATLAWSFF